jgi:steroid 5-alpha reductase family enzyme
MNPLLLSLIASMGIQLVLFVPAFGFKTDKLTDISYGLTFIVLALIMLLLHPVTQGKLIVGFMVLAWGLRLGIFLFRRILRMKKDARFDGIREHLFKFLGFWGVQGLTVWGVMLASSLYISGSGKLSWISIIGFSIWAAGISIESVADLQKSRFLAKQKGGFLDTGLWRYSQHPNYFGEILCWAGMYIFVLPGLVGWHALAGLISPLFITTILLFFSGIPKADEQMQRLFGKDKAYQGYRKRTSKLVLWIPKQD